VGLKEETPFLCLIMRRQEEDEDEEGEEEEGKGEENEDEEEGEGEDDNQSYQSTYVLQILSFFFCISVILTTLP
jgi:hypothetical protein